MRLVREGWSWSGHERNVCLLNEGRGSGALRFADISAVSGLDAPDDGRALAIVDWDRDGDLDLWFRNRTAPRLRFLENRAAAGAWVALRLRGTRANRDGIGAVVEVVPQARPEAPSGARSVRSVRAGDLFLSQSSKWLHFGLGDAAGIEAIRVLWPGGDRETFTGAKPNGRYVLEQGAGSAREWRPPASGERRAAPPSVPPRASFAEGSGADRALLPRAIPFPRLSFREQSATAAEPQPRARLLLLWSSACPHCKEELAALTAAAATLRAQGLDVLALSVDALDDDATAGVERARGLVEATGFPFAWGCIDAASVQRIQVFQNALFDRSIPFGVPLAFLMDAEANALAIYRGKTAPDVVLEDLRRTLAATNRERHHLAAPFEGSWFTNEVDDAAMALFMARRFEERLPEDALPYLDLAAARSEGNAKASLRSELVSKLHDAARRHARAGPPETAAYYFEWALSQAPDAPVIHCDYAALLGAHGRLDDAEGHLRRALEILPDLRPALDGLRWIEGLRRGGGGER